MGKPPVPKRRFLYNGSRTTWEPMSNWAHGLSTEWRGGVQQRFAS